MSEQDLRSHMLDRAAEAIGAIRGDIPGLWMAPGYPELTSNQLLDIYLRAWRNPLGSMEVYSRV